MKNEQTLESCKKILSRKQGKDNPIFFNTPAVIKDSKNTVLCSIRACVLNAKNELIVMVSDSCWYMLSVDQYNIENVLQTLRLKLIAKFA